VAGALKSSRKNFILKTQGQIEGRGKVGAGEKKWAKISQGKRKSPFSVWKKGHEYFYEVIKGKGLNGSCNFSV